MFGIFRKGGKKSKDPQHASSSESLNVRNSADFGSTASDLSLVGSSVSTESTTVENVEPSQQNAVKENANVKLQSNDTEKRSEEIEPTLTDFVYQGKEKTTPREADKDDSSPKQQRISVKLQATGQPETDTQQQKTFIKKSQEESFEIQMQSSTITLKQNEDRGSGHRDRDPDYKEEKDLPQDHSLEEKVQNDKANQALQESQNNLMTEIHFLKEQMTALWQNSKEPLFMLKLATKKT